MPSSLGVGRKEAEDLDRIKGWLRKLDVNDLEADVSSGYHDRRTTESSLQPVTPSRRPHTVMGVHEDISPTDTSFSGRSIFDKSLRKKLDCGSPSRKIQVLDDASDTSESEGEWEPTLIEECTLKSKADCAIEDPTVLQSAQSPISSSAILDSNHPSLHLEIHDSIKPAEPTTQNSHDPNTSRLVWLTSCLQCTLAGLPCSRTHPSCSRCQRTDNPELCLLHRRSFVFETLDHSKLNKCRNPILLRVKGDDDAFWQRKVDLSRELRDAWLLEQDKKNWVMPAIDSQRGGWKKKRMLQTIPDKDIHPGEGSGRMSYKELVVDLNA